MQLLLADDMLQLLQQAAHLRHLLAQLRVTVILHEQVHDLAEVAPQLLILREDHLQLLSVLEGVVGLEGFNEGAELGVHARLAGLLDGQAENFGLLAVFRLGRCSPCAGPVPATSA